MLSNYRSAYLNIMDMCLRDGSGVVMEIIGTGDELLGEIPIPEYRWLREARSLSATFNGKSEHIFSNGRLRKLAFRTKYGTVNLQGIDIERIPGFIWVGCESKWDIRLQDLPTLITQETRKAGLAA